jgi:hypothetical protein
MRFSVFSLTGSKTRQQSQNPQRIHEQKRNPTSENEKAWARSPTVAGENEAAGSETEENSRGRHLCARADRNPGRKLGKRRRNPSNARQQRGQDANRAAR